MQELSWRFYLSIVRPANGRHRKFKDTSRMKLKERIAVTLGICFFSMTSSLLYFYSIENELQGDEGSKITKRRKDVMLNIPKRAEGMTSANMSVAAFVGMQINVKLQESNISSLRNDAQRVQIIKKLIEDLKISSRHSSSSLWTIAKDWVMLPHIHPEFTPELGDVLYAMTTSQILQASAAKMGTQNKMEILLEGNQRAIFKPRKYTRDHVIEGNPYSGCDRHNGEIAAFQLNRILGLRLTPLAVGRVVDLQELKSVASKILQKTFLKKDGNTCFYGVCRFCRREDPICGIEDKLEGVVILWLPDKVTLKQYRNPWKRNYRSKISTRWEGDYNFCKYAMSLPYFKEEIHLLELTDAAIFDYLIGNADRHTLEVPASHHNARLLLIDNGKSFGNPYWDELTILAPLYQCCRVKESTYTRLTIFIDHLGTSLGELLSYDPLAPILTNAHLEAVDRRLLTVLATVHLCFDKLGKENVLKT